VEPCNCDRQDNTSRRILARILVLIIDQAGREAGVDSGWLNWPMLNHSCHNRAYWIQFLSS
jgi:hypothetical protein